MIVLGLAALALFGCLFRRRGFNPFKPSSYGRKRGDGTPNVADYQLVGMEEGGAGEDMPRSASPSSSPPTMLSRLPLPGALKRGLKLTARSLRPASSSLLPMHAQRPNGWGRSGSSATGLGQPPMLRHAASTPNLTRHASSSYPQTKFDARVVSSSSLRGTRTPPLQRSTTLGPQSSAWRRQTSASDTSDDGFGTSSLHTPDAGDLRPTNALSRTSSFTSLTALRGRAGKDATGPSALAMEA